MKRGLHRLPSTCVWELQRDALGWRITEGAGLAMLTRIALMVALSGVMYSHQAAAQEHSILTYHGDARRSGNFVVSLTWEKARSLHLDQTFNARVFGHLYAQPLYWHVPGSDAAMLLVATEDNIAQAFNALSGKELWRRKIDPKKVYFVGYSNGRQLAMTLATLSPSPAASMAIFGADLPTPDNSTCSQDSRTPPIMIVAGTDDPISPYNGGGVSIFGFQNKGTVVSAPATAEAFARPNGIDTPPSEEMLPHRDPRDPTSVQRLTWRKDSEPYVVLYSVRGGGHTVPQPVFRYPRLLGRTTEDLDGPTQAIAFFHL
jgi:hypothetical protein